MPRRRGPRPVLRPLQQGRDYYCGTCAGRGVIWCKDCGERCERPRHCNLGEVPCPQCLSGFPLVAPDFLPAYVEESGADDTPQPPRCHHADPGEIPVPRGPGECDAEASRLTGDPIGDS